MAVACSLACAQAPTAATTTPLVAPSVSWQHLLPQEKQALMPLQSRWPELSETQRSKWRTIARQFDQLPPSEQSVMHARMTEWAALSPTQRNQARLNFNTVQKLPKDEKKSKWDEYQALSKDQKRELSAGVLSPAKTAAPSAKPVNPDRLVQPAVRSLPSAAIPARPPIDSKTLLPRPPTTAPNEAPSKPAASEAGALTDAPAS